MTEVPETAVDTRERKEPSVTLPLPEGESCYLCEIVQDRRSWNLVEEAELTVTILNGRQFQVGQRLVLPKRHAPTLLELTAAEEAAVMAAVKRLTGVLVNMYAPSGVLVYQNNGIGSGQEVPHYHLHVVPRQADSDWGFGPPHVARLEAANQQESINHTAVTDTKMSTVALLRRSFSKQS